MLDLHKSENVRAQYSNDTKLSARYKLHDKHSINKQGFIPWIFEQYCFSPKDSILELGCGYGRQWEGKINNLPPGCMLTLSDFSEGMVNLVKDKFPQTAQNVNFQQIDIQNIPFEDETFNIVIANHMLYHVPDFNKAISEVRRVLKTGGCFYATTVENGGIRTFFHNAIKIFDPETEAFTQKIPFNLQNGEELLCQYFSSIERCDYEDSLSITDTQDLIDYLKSTIFSTTFPKEKFEDLYQYFEEIRLRDGAINIPKEAGLFTCVK